MMEVEGIVMESIMMERIMMMEVMEMMEVVEMRIVVFYDGNVHCLDDWLHVGFQDWFQDRMYNMVSFTVNDCGTLVGDSWWDVFHISSYFCYNWFVVFYIFLVNNRSIFHMVVMMVVRIYESRLSSDYC